MFIAVHRPSLSSPLLVAHATASPLAKESPSPTKPSALPPVGDGLVPGWSGTQESPELLTPKAAMAPPPSLPSLPSTREELEKLIEAALSDPAVEKQLIGYLQVLNASGQLRPVLGELAKTAGEAGALPPMPPEKSEELLDRFAGMIDAEFRARGMTPDTRGTVYKDWGTLSAEHLQKVRQSSAPPRTPGGLSGLADPTFVAELEKLQMAPFRSGNTVETMASGSASFDRRDQMIASAQSSIHMMSWAFYDDETGWETARALAERAQNGVDVKVMVDEQVGGRSGHRETLAFMEEHGVEVSRWRDADRPYDGQHRKMMIVDGKAMLAGGTNIGNYYSGRHGETAWRDLDVHVEGPAVTDGARLFANVWNRQAERTGTSVLEVPPLAEPVSGGVRTAVVSHQPNSGGEDPVFLSQLKAIEGATESVDIENAYFIETPALKEVLMSALERGVKVRIATNSAESIDEPVITAPILNSLPDLLEAGAEIYLKNGDTLHSKALIVDGLYSSVGSYNFHPRSHRYEGEMTVSSLDANQAASLTHAFEEGLKDTTRITSREQIQVPPSTFTTLATRFFFDQL